MLTPRRIEILEAYYASKTFREAAARLNISHQRVAQVVNEYEKRTGTKIPRADTNRPWRKSTQKYADDFINRFLSSDSWYRIAVDENKSYNGVVEIVYRYLNATKQHALLARLFPTVPNWLSNKINNEKR